MRKLKATSSLHAGYNYIKIYHLTTNIDLLCWHSLVDAIYVNGNELLYIYLYNYYDPWMSCEQPLVKYQTIAFRPGINKGYSTIAYGKVRKLFNKNISLSEFLNG